MRKATTLAAFVAVAMIAGGAHAALDDELKGSDTLETMTEEIIAACPGTGNLSYIGGGSSSGEQAMVDGTQQVSPMSRFLGASRTCQINNGTTGQGIGHSLDGLAIVRDEDTINGCTGVAFSGSIPVQNLNGVSGIQCDDCANDVYTISNNVDVTRVLYAGMETSGGSNIGAKDCNSDIRRSLAAEWQNYFQGTCATETCADSAIQHAYRRADLSGTTDTFLSLLGLPGINSVPFCNGNDLQDLDPIRRTCAAPPPATNLAGNYEEICGADGTLGLVQAIFVPEALATSIAYPNTVCQDGVFRFVTFKFGSDPCPNGSNQLFGQCLTPAYETGGPGGPVAFNCENIIAGNTPFGSNPSLDPRVYNEILRGTTGTILKDANDRELVGSYYRVHTAHTLAPGANACREPSATRQIGCLVQAGLCSVGFAGREAADTIPDSAALAVGGILPTDANVRLLLTNDPNRYPLARVLWFNTLVGFANVNDPSEQALKDCYQDRFYIDAAAQAAGFIPLTATTPPGPGQVIVPTTDFDDGLCP